MQKRGRLLTQLPDFRPEYARKLARLWLTTVEDIAGIIRLPEIEEAVSRDMIIALFADELEIPLDVVDGEVVRVVRDSIRDEEWYAMAALEEPLSFGLLAEEIEQIQGFSAPGVSPTATEELPRRVNLPKQYPERFHDIRNQNPRGTCVAFTVTALHEYIHSQIQGQLSPRLSEEFLYWAARNEQHSRDPSTCHQCGTFLGDALQALLRFGQCREEVVPYRDQLPCNLSFAEGDVKDSSFLCRNNCKYGDEWAYLATGEVAPRIGADAVIWKLDGWRIIRLFAVQDIKRVLHVGYPVAIGVPCYVSLQSPTSRHSGAITVPFQREMDDHRYQLGWHAVLVVGYENDEPGVAPTTPGGGYFILRNSWGRSWGDESPAGHPAGHGMIPYAYLTRQYFYAYTLALA